MTSKTFHQNDNYAKGILAQESPSTISNFPLRMHFMFGKHLDFNCLEVHVALPAISPLILLFLLFRRSKD